MALCSLLRKLPALGLRSPAGPLMGPVHAISPAAASRHMSHARPGPSSEAIKQMEEEYNNNRNRLRKLMADSVEATRLDSENLYSNLGKFDKHMNALVAFLYGASAILVIRQLNRRFGSTDDQS